jgi:hypothetical protein
MSSQRGNNSHELTCDRYQGSTFPRQVLSLQDGVMPSHCSSPVSLPLDSKRTLKDSCDDLQERSITELREMCRIKGLDYSSCVNRLDILDLLSGNANTSAKKYLPEDIVRGSMRHDFFFVSWRVLCCLVFCAKAFNEGGQLVLNGCIRIDMPIGG